MDCNYTNVKYRDTHSEGMGMVMRVDGSSIVLMLAMCIVTVGLGVPG